MADSISDCVKTASINDNEPDSPHTVRSRITPTPLPEEALLTDGKWFKDNRGRVCMLRGVNLSGACKLPFDTGSHTREGFYNHRQVNFVGRPFPLDEADEHFQRLKSWGFLFLRFQITWEAIEHAGPGKYDTNYMDYVVQILEKARNYGFKCFIDPHQDVWSRFTGGSGAPGWTLEMVGFDLRTFMETGAALVHNLYPQPDAFPRMIWPTNYTKLAASTMFTLFFAGKVFAPRCMVELRSLIDPDTEDKMVIVSEETYHRQQLQETPSSDSGIPMQNIQDYLQERYFKAVRALVKRIGQEADLLDTVVCGYDTLNEPSGGYLGHLNINEHSAHVDLKNGPSPTPLQAMLLGEGISCEVEQWSFTWLGPRKAGLVSMNKNNVRCWLPGYQCPWLAHGVYDRSRETALRPYYFATHPKTGESIDWIRDFWKPFIRSFSNEMRKVHPNAIIFVEPPVNEPPPVWDKTTDHCISNRICFSPHWYDGITLMNKTFQSWWTVDYVGYKRGKYSNILGGLSFGLNGIKRNFAGQLSLIRNEGLAYIGQTPCLIGEIGVPIDMANKSSYKTGDYSKQLRAMDANMTALDRNLLNFTIWNYCPDNNHQWGDQWNGEDLSIWSASDMSQASQNKLREMRRSMNADEITSLIISPSNTADEQKHRHSRVHQRTTDALMTSNSNVTTDSGVGSSFNSLTGSGVQEKNKTENVIGKHAHNRARTSPEATMFSPKKLMLPTEDLNDGARALAAFLRPYPMYTNGEPLLLSFDYDSKCKNFRFLFSNDRMVPKSDADATEIFLPKWHYGIPSEECNRFEPGHEGDKELVKPMTTDTLTFSVQVSDGTWKYDSDRQILKYFHGDTVGLGGQKVLGLHPGGSGFGVHEITVEVVQKDQLSSALKATEKAIKKSSNSLLGKAKFCSLL